MICKQEDSGYFHDNKKLANRKSVKNAVLELQNGYQKHFEENKERICDTDYTDETFETEKIVLVSNPIHTGSKEPVVWYQLGELMKNAKERVKIHTPYIICNDMMYNTWKEDFCGESSGFFYHDQFGYNNEIRLVLLIMRETETEF